MANDRKTKKARHMRGAGPKISLVLTGIGTFAILIITFILFIVNRRFINNPGWLLGLLGLSSGTDSEDSLASAFTAGLEEYISGAVSEILLMLIVILLICGIWSLIFWIICLKSKCHRVRDIICTIAGRIPIIFLGITLLRINQELTASALLASSLGNLTDILGGLVVFMFIWAFLMILLSIFGWNKKAR